MMRRFLKYIYMRFFYIIAKMYGYEVWRKWHVDKMSWYSLWLSMQFRNAGKEIYFDGFSFIVGREYISLGDYVAFGEHLYLTAWKLGPGDPCINIGENCNFGAFNHITCANHIEIGRGVLTGKWVTITDNSHGNTMMEDLQIPPMKRVCVSKGPVIIEDNVWIGDKVTILPNTVIGKGTVVAANAVVTKSVPPYSIVAGNPAKVIVTRNIND